MRFKTRVFVYFSPAENDLHFVVGDHRLYFFDNFEKEHVASKMVIHEGFTSKLDLQVRVVFSGN